MLPIFACFTWRQSFSYIRVSKIQTWRFGLCILDLGFRISGFCIFDCGFRIFDFGFGILGFRKVSVFYLTAPPTKPSGFLYLP